MIEPPCTEPYARWCERTANQLMVSFLLDCELIVWLRLEFFLYDIFVFFNAFKKSKA